MLGLIKYIKVNFTYFFFLLNMTTNKLKLQSGLYVLYLTCNTIVHIVLLLDSAPHRPGSKRSLTTSHKKILNRNPTEDP